MFEHLVIFRFVEPLSPERQADLLNTLHGFPDQIPGVVGFSAGINETEEVEHIHNYTLGLRVTFQDREALRAYLPHPAHQAFVQMLDGLLENVVVVDYPIPGAKSMDSAAEV